MNFMKVGEHNLDEIPCPSACVPVLDGDKEKACLTECRKERDEVEAYCTSEFGKLYPPRTTQNKTQATFVHLLLTFHCRF